MTRAFYFLQMEKVRSRILLARGVPPGSGREFATAKTDVAQGAFIELTDAREPGEVAAITPEEDDGKGDQHRLFLDVGKAPLRC